MCMGTKTGSNPLLVDKKFVGTALSETTDIDGFLECKKICFDDRRCRGWSFGADNTCSLYQTLAVVPAPVTEDSVGAVSGCKDQSDPACAGGMRSGTCTKCKTTGSPSDGSCGACPARTLIAGQPLRMGMHIHDEFGNEVGFPATTKVVVSCKVTDAEPDRNPDFVSRLYPNRVSRIRVTETHSQITGLNLLGSVVSSQSTLHVAGSYKITCWADTQGPDGMDSGLPDETSAEYPGGVVWTPVVSVTGATLNYDIGVSQFNVLRKEAYHNIIRRYCPTCSTGYNNLYIRVRGRFANLKRALTDDFSLVSKGQVEVYPTFKDAVDRTHGWPMDNCIGKVFTCPSPTDCTGSDICELDGGACVPKKIGFPGFCTKEDTVTQPIPGNWAVTGAVDNAGFSIDEDLIKHTVAQQVIWYVETAPGCSPRQGMPAVESLRVINDKAVSFDDCVAKVKMTYSGMDGPEANGASWVKTGGFCYGVFTEFNKQVTVTSQPDTFTCDFPMVNDWNDGGCACNGFVCPCSAPPRSNENLRKECGVTVVPASPDHLKCLSRSPDVFAGQDTTIHVAIRDAFGNRVPSARGAAFAKFAGISSPPVPAEPQGQFQSGVAMLTTRFSTAEDIQVFVSTDLPLPNGGLTSCPATVLNNEECEPFRITCPSTQEKCCSGKRLCPGVGQLAVCPADLDHVVFITQPADNIPCQNDGHIVSEIRMPPITIQVRDKFGNNKVLTPISVSVLIATGGAFTPTGTLRGTLTKSTANGEVIFDDLSYDIAEKISIRIEAMEKYAIIAQKTLTYEVKSTRVVNVCPGDICQLHEISSPKTCTFDVPNEDVVEIEARDRAGNLLRAHQVSDCRITVGIAKSDRINSFEKIGTDDFRLGDEIIPPAKRWYKAPNTDSLDDRLERNVWGHTFTQSLNTPSKVYLYGGSSTVPKNMTVGAIIPEGRTSVWEVELTRPPVWRKHWAVPDLTNANLATPGSFTLGLYGGECARNGQQIPMENCDLAGPSPRTGHSTHFARTLTKGAAGSSSSEVMFVFGGRSIGKPGMPGDCCNSDLWRLSTDPTDASKRWHQIDVSGGTIRPRLWFTQSVIYKGVMYAFSGIGGATFSDDEPMVGVDGSFELYALDLKPVLSTTDKATLSWTRVNLPAHTGTGKPSPPRARAGAATALVGSRWYIIGGVTLSPGPSINTDVWSIDLNDLLGGWRLEDDEGPSVILSSWAFDPYRKEVTFYGGSNDFGSVFSDFPTGSRYVDQKLRVYSIEDKEWLSDDDLKQPVAAGGGCIGRKDAVHPQSLATGFDASTDRCGVFTSQATCEAAGDVCTTLTPEQCVASGVYSCALISGGCVKPCAWEASLIPARRILGGQGVFYEWNIGGDEIRDAMFMIGGVSRVTPEGQSSTMCGSKELHVCSGDADLWYLQHQNRFSKVPQTLAWDLNPHNTACRTSDSSSSCGPGWFNSQLCTGATSGGNPCRLREGVVLTENAIICNPSEPDCVRITGPTSSYMRNGANVEFDGVIISSSRNIAVAGFCSGPAAACNGLGQTACEANGACTWNPSPGASKTRQLLTQLSVTVTCDAPRVNKLCRTRPLMLSSPMKCSRCKLTMMPNSSPRKW